MTMVMPTRHLQIYKRMKTTKKILAAGLALFILSGFFAGCAKKEGGQEETSTQESTVQPDEDNENLVKIGIVQIVDHTSLNEIREAFLAELKQLGVNADIDYKDAQGDMASLSTICQTFVGDKKDLIVAIATPSAQAALNAAEGTDIPVVFSAVTDPVGAELLTSMEKPDKNATGTSDLINVEEIFALAETLTPQAKTFGLLYTTGEANSVSVINEVKEYAAASGISVVDKGIAGIGELQQALESMTGQVDAIFSPIDNTIANAMTTVAQYAREQKIPVYPAADSMVQDGGFATKGINYTNLGKETALIASKILQGTPVSEIPVVILQDLDTVINTDTAEILGIDIPEDIMDSAKIFE